MGMRARFGEEVILKAIRSINNNIAVCIDSTGTEVVAMGKGIGYGAMPHEVELSQISHTYYSVDPHLLSGIQDIPEDVLAFTAKVVDAARGQIHYRMSSNLVFTLADHIAFAIKRSKSNLKVKMPLAYDIEQNFPDEYRVARQIVRRIRREFGAALPNDEAAGIAMNFLNARIDEASEEESRRAQADEDMLEDITEIIENEFETTVDRSSFAFSRYATHMHYLFCRLHTGEKLEASGLLGYQGIEDQFPEGVACVERIAQHIEDAWGAALSAEEKLYLVIHVSRICIKGSGR